jgi:hypothetical protein
VFIRTIPVSVNTIGFLFIFQECIQIYLCEVHAMPMCATKCQVLFGSEKKPLWLQRHEGDLSHDVKLEKTLKNDF